MLAALVIGPLVLLAGCVMLVFGWRRRANGNKKSSIVQVGALWGFRYQKDT